MSRERIIKKHMYVDVETGEMLPGETRIKSKGNKKGRFLIMLEQALDRLMDDWDDTALRAAFRTYWFMLKRLKIGDNKVDMHPREIMQRFNIKELAARKHLKILEEKGYITKVLGERGHHVYTINKLIFSKG